MTKARDLADLLDASGNIIAQGTIDGRDLASDGSKLDSIEHGATGDQTHSEIRALITAGVDTNVFTDADHSKLDGIEAGATADQTAAEIKTAYESNANTNEFSDAEQSKLAGIETGATADQTKADIDALNVDADTLDGQHGSYYTSYADTAVANIVDSAPGTLDTLNELAAALGDDPNFATTTATNIGTKANKTITVSAGNGLTGGGDLTANRTISHADTSSQASVDNSGRTYIQDITLDTYGHITGITSATETVVNTDTTYSSGSGLNLTGTTFSVTDAPKWTTARTLSLSGDASGSVSWDGSGNATLSVAVANDSHSHSNYITSNANDTASGRIDFTAGITAQTLDIGVTGDRTIQALASDGSFGSYGDLHLQHYGGNLYMLHGGGTAYIDDNVVWHAGNDGSGSGLDADHLDGVQGSSYLRSDAADSKSGNLNLTSGTELLVGGEFSHNAYNQNSSSTIYLGGGGNDRQNYSIGTEINNYGGNYTKLDLRWHTGIRMFAQQQYGGLRYYTDSAMNNKIFSVGEGDSNVRVTNTIYAGAFSGDGSNLTGIDAGAPAGSIMYHAGSSAPSGYVKANGASLSTSTYSALFSAIGYTYGGSGGSFNVPDLRGEFIRGWDDGRGVDSGRSFGSSQGDAMRNLTGSFTQVDDNANYYRIKLLSTSGVFSGIYHVGNPFNSVGTGGGQGFNAGVDFNASNQVPVASQFRPRNVALLACIKY